jgi:hypothetical protein
LPEVFDATAFLAAAVTRFFAPLARDFLGPFESFDRSLFIFSSAALREARTFEAGLFLLTRFRPLEAGVCFPRFAAIFVRAVDAAPFALDFVVFFTFVRAAIVNSPRATTPARAANPCTKCVSST